MKKEIIGKTILIILFWWVLIFVVIIKGAISCANSTSEVNKRDKHNNR